MAIQVNNVNQDSRQYANLGEDQGFGTSNNGRRQMKNSKLIRVLIALVILVVLGVGGYFLWRNSSQSKLIKTANTAHSTDTHYVSFGADYVFAVPSSFVVDESSITGVQLLLPAGGASLQVSDFNQLFDATVVAVQPLSQIKPNDNKALKDYVNQTLLPDIKKNISPDTTVKFSVVGKYQAATISSKKDGSQIRQTYVYGGSHPFMVVSKEKTDVSTEVTVTLIGTSDSSAKDDINLIKQAAQSNTNLLLQGKYQELLDASASDFKQKTTLKDLTTLAGNSSTYLHRNVVLLGGTFQADQFAGQLYFTPPTKDDQAGIGVINLRKENGQWKVVGFQLPTNPAPAPAPSTKK